MDFTLLGTHTTAAWEDDWTLVNATGATAGGVVLATEPSPTYVSPDAVDFQSPPGFEVADIDTSACGHLYVLFRRAALDSGTDTDVAGEVHRYDPVREQSEVVVCVPDGRLEPTSLCVARESIYVASQPRSPATVDGQVRAFTRYSGETRWVATTARVPPVDGDDAVPVNVRFERPVALACAGDAVYAVDRGRRDAPDNALPGFVVRLGEDGRATVVDENLVEPRDVAVDDEGTVLVLETENGSVVLAYRADEPETGLSEPDRVSVPGTDPAFTLSCLDAVNPREVLAGVGPAAGQETTLFRYRLSDESMVRVASYKRSALRLVVERGGENDDGGEGYATGGVLYVVDGIDRTVYRLTEMWRDAVNAHSGRRDAQVVRRFDSAARATQWHRVRLEASQRGITQDAGGTQIRLRYYATDDEDESVYDLQSLSGVGETRAETLDAAGIDDLWDLLERTPESVADHFENVSPEMVTGWQSQAWTGIEQRWNEVGQALDRPDPTDALLSSATGRYLWVRLELAGSEYSSPRLDTFRVYLPRQSYLRYLPEVYQADAQSADFLERFLSIFESTFTDLSEDIESVTRYLDPHGVPEPYLSWLGRWLGVDLDEAWSERARRRFLEAAPELFTMRGTRAGLLATLQLYLDSLELSTLSWDRARERERARLDALLARGTLTDAEWIAARDRHAALADERESRAADVRPLLIEYSDLDCIDTEAPREAYTRLVSCPQCFLVLLPAPLDEEAARTAQRIVETEQPAHTVGRAVTLRHEVQLGSNSYLGVNTALPRRDLVVGQSSLGSDSVLTTRETFGQLDVKSRVGKDTTLS